VFFTANHTKQDKQYPIDYHQCLLDPGQVIYSADPTLICAVCGNGVAVTIQDPVLKVGGMAHCIFPHARSFQTPSNYHSNYALMTLYDRLTKTKPLSRKAEAQLFGGGHLCGMKKGRAEEVLKNIRAVLSRLKISIASEDVGGVLGRKVIFNTFTGETIVMKTKKIRKSDWLPEYPRR
jgi:chemotaxis protein CheD